MKSDCPQLMDSGLYPIKSENLITFEGYINLFLGIIVIQGVQGGSN